MCKFNVFSLKYTELGIKFIIYRKKKSVQKEHTDEG